MSNSTNKPLILVTNDDGINAPGIRALVEVAQTFGEVWVVAPDSPQSGQGHAITLEQPLRLYPVRVFEGIEAYECSGTPADCVKLAKNILLKGRNVDLCLSGINHGSNASINILYSGTLSAAMEAAIEGIPSIGFSLLNFDHAADMKPAQHYVRQIVAYTLSQGLGKTKLINVNIPNLPLEEIKGIKVCRQAEGYWTEDFLQGRDPQGRPYYWLTGRFICSDRGEDTDIGALDRGFVSVVPSMHDFTAHHAIAGLKGLEG
jgi:5'-nucleotidase